jgi:putative hydrolase of the HAD superfamily
MIETIIFDLGGVLVNLEWDKTCAPLGQMSEHSHEFVLKEILNGPIVLESMRGAITPEEFHRNICEKLGIRLSYEEFVEIWNRLLQPNEGITSLVEELRLDYSLVLGSNTDRIHFPYSVQHFPVLKNFERCFLSYDMGLVKPDPEFFLRILDDLSVSPKSCLFIDDRPENVDSAQEVGITALRFQGNQELRRDLAAIG